MTAARNERQNPSSERSKQESPPRSPRAKRKVPASAKAVFNIRFNDRWTGEAVKRWLAERLDMVGGRYDLDVSVSGEAFLVPPGAVGERLAEAIHRVTGKTPEFSTTGGTSDARFIRTRCPVAEFGLVGQRAHQVDERVALADLAALTDIYDTFLGLYFDSP